MISTTIGQDCCILLLIPLVAVCVLGSSAPCPSGCECIHENLQPFGDVLTVTCLEVTSIPDLSVLRETKLMKYLRLEDNSLSTVTEEDFPAGLNITVLDLSQNKGLQISDNAFLNLGSSLKKLKLETIEKAFNGTLSMLDPLFSLKELSLSYNNKHPYVKGAVQNIDTPLLQGEVAKSITKLKLSFCGIRTLSASSLENLKKLKELDLSNNWFTAIPQVVKYLPGLTFLELFYCSIESIKDYDFSSSTHLKDLDLSSNRKLNTIEPKAFSGLENSLVKLKLLRCNLTEVPSVALRNLKKLTHLDISENHYESIEPGALEGDYKLNELIIGSRNLHFDLNMFQGQEENIVDLKIMRMGLQSIPLEPIKQLPNLKVLSFEHNKIAALPARAFGGIPASIIYLGDNPISSIDPEAFDEMQPGLVINLRNTEMDDIDFLIGYPDTAIETVDFGQSKLVCRCSMKSSLNATLNIRIYGSCTNGTKVIPISSTRLEGIIDQACKEERKAANVGARRAYSPTATGLLNVLVLALSVFGFFHINRLCSVLTFIS